ncbi:uncharacterized protein LOC124696050 [Lolium rigidum]|uniref:uncharacterized protein LOC124696050 n=1 Tax=Lolium rigidum TaxID=89674 RepID=UPI001F5D4F51|nr:uncharacterized protein LOC124696050 [Lolium rigidum]
MATGGGSKRRHTDEEGGRAQPGLEEDRITTLPEALRLHILALLPLKSAIRTGALSTQWRALWTRRWPDPASMELRVAALQPLMESLERRGRRRIDRFSLSFEMGELTAEEFRRCLHYAAACAVADLQVHLSRGSNRILKFRLPRGNPHLQRLSLEGIGVGLPNPFRYESHPHSVLDAISLHRVTISDHDVFSLVAACPLLRTLDLRYCKGLRRGNFPAGAYLKSVTFAECKGLAGVLFRKAPGLRSFRYSGGYLAADQIPTTIDDLYLCFGGPDRGNCLGGTTYDADGRLCRLRRSCLDALIDAYNLTVITLCSSALRRVSGKARAKSIHGNAAVCRLQNLREVQLLMFAMFEENLHDIMDFLMTCCSPRLERLFVQLPTRSGQYKPQEEPSDSEEDGSEEDELEEELSEEHECKMHAWDKHLCYGEEPEKDQSEQTESEEEVSEENHSEEDEPEEDESEEEVSEENHSKVDESEEVWSEEDELEEELSEGSEESHFKVDESEDDGSEEDELEEELSEGSEYIHFKVDESEDDGSEEDELPEGQASEEDETEGEESGEDQSEEEGSEESVEEPLGNGCENLIFLKMMNFMGRHNEMRLLSFLLKRSPSLNQLILFTPSDHPKGLHKDHLVTSDFLETKLLPLEKASLNAQIILSEPDTTAVQPLHWEIFVKV